MKDGDCLYALLPEPGRHAAKTFQWVSDQELRLEHSYDAGWRFKTARRPNGGGLTGIRDLADLLGRAESAAGPRGAFIIRGRLRDEVDSNQPVNRRYKEKSDRPPPCWERHPEGRRWVMVDLDDLEPPDWLRSPVDETDLARAVEYATQQLPVCFRDVTTFYQWSSSAGLVKEGDGDLYRPGWSSLRLHLWYWCDRRACSESLREWLKSYHEEAGAPIDWRVFNPVQPHFISRPTFLGGPDPIGDARSGLLPGWEEVVELPDYVLPGSEYDKRQKEEQKKRRKKRQEARSRPRVRSWAQMQQAEERYAAAALERATEAISCAPVGHRETTLRDEAFGIGTLVGAGALNEGQALNALVEAGVTSGLPRDEATDKATRALDAGKDRPRDLTEVRRAAPERQSSRCEDSPRSGPGVEEIRDHFEAAKGGVFELLPDEIDPSGCPDGTPLTDWLMPQLHIDDFIRVVEQIRERCPEHLPKRSTLHSAA